MHREEVVSLRVRAQQLDRVAGDLADTAVLDLGVQDTGPDGGGWALACRGVPLEQTGSEHLVTVWTLRGAPHLYRRTDLPGVAAAVAPFSEADAGKRIFDAATPLRAAGIGALEALDVVAAAMREIVDRPTAKHEMSARLSERLPEPYLKHCAPCRAVHVHEQSFRLAALRAGLELQPGTSPPVLQPVPGLRADPAPPPRLDVVRGYLRLLGPATPKHVAAHLDAPVAEVRARWPDDVVDVEVDGEARSLLAASLPAAPGSVDVRLLGPYDPFLQARDRDLLVPDRVRAKALWSALGRPGAVLANVDLVGLWRPRQTGSRLRLQVELWCDPTPQLRGGLEQQAERLAAFRGVRLTGIDGA